MFSLLPCYLLLFLDWSLSDTLQILVRLFWCQNCKDQNLTLSSRPWNITHVKCENCWAIDCIQILKDSETEKDIFADHRFQTWFSSGIEKALTYSCWKYLIYWVQLASVSEICRHCFVFKDKAAFSFAFGCLKSIHFHCLAADRMAFFLSSTTIFHISTHFCVLIFTQHHCTG